MSPTELDPQTSRSTGRPLRRVEVSFVAGEALYDRVSDDLHKARREAPLVDEDGTSWRVGDWSSSSSNNGTSSRFEVAMVEVEQLTVTGVEFLGYAFDVDFYDEETDSTEGYLSMQAEVVVPADQVRPFADMLWGGDSNGFFELRRVGADEHPIRARFGRIVWQAEEDGARRFSIMFVQPPNEDDDPAADNKWLMNEPALRNTERIAIAERARLRALVDELRNAGVLDDAAVQRISESAEAAWESEAAETLAETRLIEIFRLND